MRSLFAFWLCMLFPLFAIGFLAKRNQYLSPPRRHCDSRSFSPLSSSNNPFSSMIGDMASSIFGSAGSVSANPKVESRLSSTTTLSWQDIRKQLEVVQTPEERSFRSNLTKGYGVGSPLHKIRLYDESNREEDIRVTFYRDSASWCKCFQFDLKVLQSFYRLNIVFATFQVLTVRRYG